MFTHYRFFGAFRLLLAAMVVVQHSLPSFGSDHLRAVLAPLEIGSVAVLLFFVLSGFIIVEAAALFYEGRPVPFAINRLIRIYPPYIVAVLLTAVILTVVERLGGHEAAASLFHGRPEFVWTDLSWVDVAANLFAIVPFVGKLIGGAEPILDLAWALRIELVFYAVVALAIAAGHRAGQPAARPLGLAAIMLLAYDAANFGDLRGKGLEFTPYFVLGASVYFTMQPASLRRRVLAFVLVLVSGLMIANHISGQTPVNQNAGVIRDLGGQFALFFGGLCVWLGLIALPVFWPAGTQRLSATDQRLGELTYPLYLTHMAALLPCVWLLPRLSVPFGSTLLAAVSLAFAVAVAVVMHWAVETPLAAIRRRVREQKSPVRAAAPAPP